jgi:hypothetical protein
VSEIKTMTVTIQSIERPDGKTFVLLHVDELKGPVFIGPPPLQDHLGGKKAGDTIELVYRENNYKNGWVAVNIDGLFKKKAAGPGGGSGNSGSSGGYRKSYQPNEPMVFGQKKGMVMAWVKDIVLAKDCSVDEAVVLMQEISEKLDAKK